MKLSMPTIFFVKHYTIDLKENLKEEHKFKRVTKKHFLLKKIRWENKGSSKLRITNTVIIVE
jgi:hypothetical protein